MITAIGNTSALFALRLSFTFDFASRWFTDDEEPFPLGNFLSEYTDDALLGATDQERAALYEPALAMMEAAFGPLQVVYRSRGDGISWGYAGLHSKKNPLNAENGEPRVELMNRRISALGSGHPDQTYWNAGNIPDGAWKLPDGSAG